MKRLRGCATASGCLLIMKLDKFLKNQGAWMGGGGDSDIVISSRVRLARNLRDETFPGRASDEQRLKIWGRLKPVLASLAAMDPSVSLYMGDLSDLDRMILFERHLISRELTVPRAGQGVVIRQDERAAIMVNEEDHLRLQALRPGLMLQNAWECVDEMDSRIEEMVPYAFSEKLGYLTSCPTNVGTGMRASVMLHLPGLVFMEEVGPVIKGLNKIGLTVRGLWGEGTEAVGNMFQVSNLITLGDCEKEIVSHLQTIVEEVVEHEQNARLRLMESREHVVLDYVGRALGILSNAHILASKEALGLLSGLRLGIEMGILKDFNRQTVDDLLVSAQPAHLQMIEKAELAPEERDRARAELIRKRLARRRNRKRSKNE